METKRHSLEFLVGLQHVACCFLVLFPIYFQSAVGWFSNSDLGHLSLCPLISPTFLLRAENRMHIYFPFLQVISYFCRVCGLLGTMTLLWTNKMLRVIPKRLLTLHISSRQQEGINEAWPKCSHTYTDQWANIWNQDSSIVQDVCFIFMDHINKSPPPKQNSSSNTINF